MDTRNATLEGEIRAWREVLESEKWLFEAEVRRADEIRLDKVWRGQDARLLLAAPPPVPAAAPPRMSWWRWLWAS